MRDEKGYDFKVLCVAIGDAHQQHIEQLDQVRPHRLVEIEQFFPTYKVLEDKAVEVIGWRDREAALQVLATDRETWQREVERARRALTGLNVGGGGRLDDRRWAAPIRRGAASPGCRHRGGRGHRRGRPRCHCRTASP